MNNYILVDGQPVMEPDLMKWEKWYEKFNRTIIKTKDDTHIISTVFLGLDYNFGGIGRPILFETIVFKLGDWSDLDCSRYTTQEEAKAGHSAMTAKWGVKMPDES